MSVQSPDDDQQDSPPFDPRTAREGYRVTIRYQAIYADGEKTVSGPVNPHFAEEGYRAAIYDGDERTVSLRASGLVYSHKSEQTRIGMGGEVIEIQQQD